MFFVIQNNKGVFVDCVDDVIIYSELLFAFYCMQSIKKDDNSYCQCTNKITKFI